MHGRKGFTLVEMLIVIAIIAILIAIAIPVASAQLEKSRATVCAANRRSLQSVLTGEYYLSDLDTNGENIILTEYQKENHICPDGGEITAKLFGNSVGVYCDYHRAYFALRDPFTLEKVMAIMNKSPSNVKVLDSGAKTKSPPAHSDTAIKALNEIGIDVTELGAKSWQFSKESGNKQYFYWTDKSIEQLPEGSEVPVIRYDSKTQKYSVWISTVNMTCRTANDTRYNALNTAKSPNPNSPSTRITPIAYEPEGEYADEYDYETAIELLKRAQEEYGYY